MGHLVSIILPFRDADQTLERAVQSILSQTFQDFTLILVDNNSTDNSYKIAGKTAQKDSRIVLVKESKFAGYR